MSAPLAWYNEIDPYCCDVLRARIADGSLPPGVVDPRDVRLVHPAELASYAQLHFFAGIGGLALALRLAGVPDDARVATGGFPCQDISLAGDGAGLNGTRSGLFFALWDLVRSVRPVLALLENVSALVARGLDRVLGALAESGFDAEWDCLTAAAIGAPHQRDRIWIAAYPDRVAVRHLAGRIERVQAERAHAIALHHGSHGALADDACCRVDGREIPARSGQREAPADAERHGLGLPNAARLGCNEWEGGASARERDAVGRGAIAADAHRVGLETARLGGRCATEVARPADHGGWAAEPNVGRVVHGVRRGLDRHVWESRIHGLGNAVVPAQAAEALARLIPRALEGMVHA